MATPGCVPGLYTCHHSSFFFLRDCYEASIVHWPSLGARVTAARSIQWSFTFLVFTSSQQLMGEGEGRHYCSHFILPKVTEPVSRLSVQAQLFIRSKAFQQTWDNRVYKLEAGDKKEHRSCRSCSVFQFLKNLSPWRDSWAQCWARKEQMSLGQLEAPESKERLTKVEDTRTHKLVWRGSH